VLARSRSMLDPEGRSRNASSVLTAFKEVRRERSGRCAARRLPGSGISGRQIQRVDCRGAASGYPGCFGPVTRASRLGVALNGMALELAAARREIVLLKRENAALRSGNGTRDANDLPSIVTNRRSPADAARARKAMGH
jgi:hypothetical protein